MLQLLAADMLQLHAAADGMVEILCNTPIIQLNFRLQLLTETWSPKKDQGGRSGTVGAERTTGAEPLLNSLGRRRSLVTSSSGGSDNTCQHNHCMLRSHHVAGWLGGLLVGIPK
jgi:hypothetical protein